MPRHPQGLPSRNNTLHCYAHAIGRNRQRVSTIESFLNFNTRNSLRQLLARPTASRRSKAAEQPLDIIEFQRRPGLFAEPPPQLFQNLACPLHIDLIGNFYGIAEIGAFRPLRPAHWIERRIRARTHAEFTALPHHLLGHGLGPLAKLFKRVLLGFRGPLEIALFERALGLLHRPLGAIELLRRGHPELLHFSTHLSHAIAQFTLTLAQPSRVLARILAWLAVLAITLSLTVATLPTLATLPALAWLLPWLLSLLAWLLSWLLALLPLLTILAVLLAKRVVEKLLLFADDVPELVHHLHHLLALLTLLPLGHPPILQLLEQVAELAEHLLC